MASTIMSQEVSWTDILEKHPALRWIKPIPEDWEILPKHLCAFESFLYVAVGQEVRSLDCRLLKHKNEASHKNFYKKLFNPELDFMIEQICLSKNGRFLAVVGKSKIVILGLRSKLSEQNPLAESVSNFGESVNNFSNSEHQENGTNSLKLSEVTICSVAVINPSSQIVSVRFHPLGKSGRSLVVLTETSLLLYEAGNGVLMPDYEIPLKLTHQASNSFDADVDLHIPTAFCFSNVSQGWGVFTIYILTRGGDVFSVCPVMPANAMIPQDVLKQIRLILTKKEDDADAENHRRNVHWITKLLGEAALANDLSTSFVISEGSSELFDSSDYVSVRRPDDFSFIPSMQGPFLLQPAVADDELIEDYCDIYSFGMNPIDVLAIGGSEGRLDLLLLVSEVSGRWSKLNDHGLASMKLIVSQVHSLYLSNNNPYMVLQPDIQSPYSLIAYHANGLHVVDIESWARDLNLNFENGEFLNNEEENDEDELSNVLVSIPSRTSVLERLDTNPLNESTDAVVGCAQLYYPSLGKILISLTRNWQTTVFDDSDLATMGVNKESLSNEMDYSKSLGTSSLEQVDDLDEKLTYTPLYVSLLEKTPFTDPSIPSLVERTIVPAELQNEITVSSASLRFLGKVVARYRETLNLLDHGCSELHHRLKLQREEYERQQNHIYKLSDRISNFREKAWSTEHLEHLTSDMSMCEKRIDQVLQRVMDLRVPDLSDKEKQFIKEIGNYKEKVTGERGIEKRVETLKTLLQRTKPRDAQTTLVASSSDMRLAAIEQLQKLLAQQSLSIKELKTKTVSFQRLLQTS
ncbi:Nucleoporin nup82 [Schizosaccharomyces pombe]